MEVCLGNGISDGLLGSFFVDTIYAVCVASGRSQYGINY
jgi:hypothetical protein